MQKFTRRRFLELSSAASMFGATPLFTSASESAGPGKQKKLGVALVGLGSYSTNQLAPGLQLTKHCELRGIVTGSPEKIPVWQEKYGIQDRNVYSYDNMHEMANNDDIDVVYIVLPTSLHKEYTIKAANAGKHVWCEKPMAMDVNECQQMIDACRKNNVKLTIGYRMQHEPNTQTVMAYAQQKPYGDIKNIIARAGYKGSEPSADNWRIKRAMGGGAMYDMGVYPLNGARSVIGQEPIAVSAVHKIVRPKTFTEVDEETYFTLEFPNDVVADCATSVYQDMNFLRTTCEDGWYELTPFQSYTGVQGITSDGLKLNKQVNHQQAKKMDDDSLAILNNTPVQVPGEEGLKDIKVVEAIFKSASSNGKRIEI